MPKSEPSIWKRFDGERITVGQAHGFDGELVGDDGHTLDVLWVALVELRGFAGHARERMTVHVGRIGGNMRNATRGETGDNSLRDSERYVNVRNPP